MDWKIFDKEFILKSMLTETPKLKVDKICEKTTSKMRRAESEMPWNVFYSR